uniref:Uncharacterized protein n=1 Tax=Rhizophora mucronata TaxID=61149 RepID=A0A2P2NFS7_RHIMU
MAANLPTNSVQSSDLPHTLHSLYWFQPRNKPAALVADIWESLIFKGNPIVLPIVKTCRQWFVHPEPY